MNPEETKPTMGGSTTDEKVDEGNTSCHVSFDTDVPASHNTRSRNTKTLKRMPTFIDMSNINIEKCVGSGAFSSVYRARFHSGSSFCRQSSTVSSCGGGGFLCEANTEDDTLSDTENDEFMSSSSRQYYALKKLSKKTLADSDPSTIEAARKDLTHEATILLKISSSHENIITLYAVSSNFFDDVPNGFLLLEQLSETLNCRLDRWRAEKKAQVAMPGWATPLFKQNKDRYEQEQVHRMSMIGLPIARAMAFLHSHRICYRDLKPANVGFDIQTNKVRLFDFGLARVLDDDEERRLTGFTGTSRYMAPGK